MFGRDGLKKLAQQLDAVSRNSKAMDGTQSVPLTELLTPEFLTSHTRFANLQTMLEAGGFGTTSPQDLDSIPAQEWERFIRAATPFPSWQAMLGQAVAHYTRHRFGL